MLQNGNQRPNKTVIPFRRPRRDLFLWRQLEDHNSAFQHILRLLIKHEQEFEKENLSWLFYIRKAVSLCDPQVLWVFMHSLGGYLFHVVVQIEVSGLRLATSWLHEDGIQSERDARTNQKDHPIHHILCLSDLYAKHTKIINTDTKQGCPSQAAIRLMLES